MTGEPSLRGDERVTGAAQYLRRARMWPPNSRTRTELVKEDGDLRGHLGAVLDAISNQKGHSSE